jgi:hypothetical protein
MGRESWALMKQVVPPLLQQKGDKNHPNNNWRVACLELTQQDDNPNQLAKRVLTLDKEWHLMRYHGIQKYLQQHNKFLRRDMVGEFDGTLSAR